jgi:hypothetical protein
MRSVACCFLALVWTVLSTNCVLGSCGDHLAHQHKLSAYYEIAPDLGDLPEPSPLSPCSLGQCKGNLPLSPTVPFLQSNMEQFGCLQGTGYILKSGPFNRFSSGDFYPPIAPQIDLVLPPPRDVA